MTTKPTATCVCETCVSFEHAQRCTEATGSRIPQRHGKRQHVLVILGTQLICLFTSSAVDPFASIVSKLSCSQALWCARRESTIQLLPGKKQPEDLQITLNKPKRVSNKHLHYSLILSSSFASEELVPDQSSSTPGTIS